MVSFFFFKKENLKVYNQLYVYQKKLLLTTECVDQLTQDCSNYVKYLILGRRGRIYCSL